MCEVFFLWRGINYERSFYENEKENHVLMWTIGTYSRDLKEKNANMKGDDACTLLSINLGQGAFPTAAAAATTKMERTPSPSTNPEAIRSNNCVCDSGYRDRQ